MKIDASTRRDAEQRLADLRRVRNVLWPDRHGDIDIALELRSINGEIRQAEQVLRTEPTHQKETA